MHCMRHSELWKTVFSVFIVTLFVESSKADTTPLTPIIIPANYSYPYTYSLNKSIEYVFLYSENAVSIVRQVLCCALNFIFHSQVTQCFFYTYFQANMLEVGARIVVESEDAKSNYPLIVVVRQKKGILSWQIPLEVENKYLENPILYSITSRTLCPASFYKTVHFEDSDDQYVTISISTASSENITFNLSLTPVENFYMR